MKFFIMQSQSCSNYTSIHPEFSLFGPDFFFFLPKNKNSGTFPNQKEKTWITEVPYSLLYTSIHAWIVYLCWSLVTNQWPHGSSVGVVLCNVVPPSRLNIFLFWAKNKNSVSFPNQKEKKNESRKSPILHFILLSMHE